MSGEVVNCELIARLLLIIWAPVGEIKVLVSTYFVY